MQDEIHNFAFAYIKKLLGIAALTVFGNFLFEYFICHKLFLYKNKKFSFQVLQNRVVNCLIIYRGIYTKDE